MVVDPQATGTGAVRTRGPAVLASTGRQIAVQLRPRCFLATGNVEPDAMIRYQDGCLGL
jgi:hypothetical protein